MPGATARAGRIFCGRTGGNRRDSSDSALSHTEGPTSLSAMSVDWEPCKLEVLWRTLWRALESAPAAPGHPWRTPVLATAGDEGGARVIVLRDAVREERSLTFHSDLRSPKIEALRRSPRVAWVFYSPEWQVQVRVRARAFLHVADPVAAAHWVRVPPAARANYSGDLPPGASRAHPFAGEYLERTGEAHFVVVETHAEAVDWLWLPPGAPLRAGWDWDGEGWRGGWLTP